MNGFLTVFLRNKSFLSRYIKSFNKVWHNSFSRNWNIF